MNGDSKGSIGYLIENDLNITETMNDWLNEIIKKYYLSGSDIQINHTNSMNLTTSNFSSDLISSAKLESKNDNFTETNLTTEVNPNDATNQTIKLNTFLLDHFDTINSSNATIQSILSYDYETNETTLLNSSISNYQTNISLLDYSTVSINNRESVTVSPVKQVFEYLVNNLYFTGILLQHIQFDDKYWLNGFEFEALTDGIIKIGVILS